MRISTGIDGLDYILRGGLFPGRTYLVHGEPGTGKSPGSDALMRDVLPEIERRMLADFPDRLSAWRTDVALSKAAKQRSRRERCHPTIPGAVITPAPVLVTSHRSRRCRDCGSTM